MADSPKWLFGNYIGTKEIIFGNMGPRAMEFLQNFHHFFKGKFLSLLKPSLYQRARLIFGLGLFDKEIRKTLKNYLKYILQNPKKILQKCFFQTIVVMQPQDILPNGEQDQCDGCPNKTFWNGKLISECRLEDYLKYGRLIHAVRKR